MPSNRFSSTNQPAHRGTKPAEYKKTTEARMNAEESLVSIGFNPILKMVSLYYEAEKTRNIPERRKILSQLMAVRYPKQKAITADVRTHNKLQIIFEDQTTPELIEHLRAQGALITGGDIIEGDLSPEQQFEAEFEDRDE